MAKPSINDVMEAYARDAVDFAKARFDVTLDFTAASISNVESIADRLYRSKPRGVLGKLFGRGPSEQDVDAMCKMLGGYVGEVLRREKGGEWGINEDLQAYGVRFGETWVFPPAKVHKRLTNGSEDNIEFYFRVLLAQS